MCGSETTLDRLGEKEEKDKVSDKNTKRMITLFSTVSNHSVASPNQGKRDVFNWNEVLLK